MRVAVPVPLWLDIGYSIVWLESYSCVLEHLDTCHLVLHSRKVVIENPVIKRLAPFLLCLVINLIKNFCCSNASDIELLYHLVLSLVLTDEKHSVQCKHLDCVI